MSKFITRSLTVFLLAGLLLPSFQAAASAAATDSQIAAKYGLQSFTVQKVGGGIVASYHANEHPSYPASLLKPILADLAIRNGKSINATIKVESKHLYGCGLNGNYKVGQRVSFGKALNRALRNSDNVAANLLISFGGGLEAMNYRAHDPHVGAPYGSTNIVEFYGCNGNNNTTTAADVSRAMNTIFTARQPNDYGVARSALKGAASADNYWGVGSAYANKYAAFDKGSRAVSGNSAIIRGKKKSFIVTVYVNRAGAGPAIRGATADLAKRAFH